MKKKTFDININWDGIIFILLAGIIYYFRPLQTCSWWNIFCHAGSMALTPIFLLISLILLVVGVIKLLRKKKE